MLSALELVGVNGDTSPVGELVGLVVFVVVVWGVLSWLGGKK